jgi:hypothetical protein
VHPIEWIGVEVGLALCERLAADPPRDRRVIVLPLVNVDGFRRVEANRRAGRRRWIRHNDAGVDLNRNFPVLWRARSRLAWPNFPGGAPADQPEVRAIVRALRAEPIDRALSLHSFGRKLVLPWAGRFRRPARWRELQDAARAIAERMPERYDIVQASRWAPGVLAWGLELDWLHGDLGALAILVECTAGGGLSLDPFDWYNPRAPDPDAIAHALEPFARGSL